VKGLLKELPDGDVEDQRVRFLSLDILLCPTQRPAGINISPLVFVCTLWHKEAYNARGVTPFVGNGTSDGEGRCISREMCRRRRAIVRCCLARRGRCLVGLSGLYKTGSSKEESDAGDRHWALVSWGGAVDGRKHKLALRGEHDHGQNFRKIFCWSVLFVNFI
jgi:hypothetical protein